VAIGETIPPAQIVAEGGLITIEGGEVTITVTATVPVQPKAFIPVTVMLWELGGLTVVMEPVAPVDQV